MHIGAIEAGGTKFICGIGNENGEIEDQISFPTEHPEVTLPKVIQYFQGKQVEAIGIGSLVRLIFTQTARRMVTLQQHQSQGGEITICWAL